MLLREVDKDLWSLNRLPKLFIDFPSQRLRIRIGANHDDKGESIFDDLSNEHVKGIGIGVEVLQESGANADELEVIRDIIGVQGEIPVGSKQSIIIELAGGRDVLTTSQDSCG